ncbi:MAG: recombinase family protein [Thermacetogeniaceae bacterium]
MRQIGEKLCELGCYPKRGENRYWSASSIRRILTSEIYIGRYFYNRRKFSKVRGEKTSGGRPKRRYVYRERSEWVEVEVPGIVDEALFEMAQRQREKNRKAFSGNIKNEYLLRSLLRCGKCGHAWVCTTYPGKKGKTYPVYRCINRYPRKFGGDKIQRCDARTIRADLLDEYVWNQIEELVFCPDVLFKALQNREEANAAALKENLKAIECQIMAKIRERERLKRMFVLEVISEDEMNRSLARVNLEIERLRKEAGKYMKLLDDREKNIRKSCFIQLLGAVLHKRVVDGGAGEKAALPFRLKRNIVELLIDEIVVEFRDEEVVLSYVGVLDELLKNRLLGSSSIRNVGSDT